MTHSYSVTILMNLMKMVSIYQFYWLLQDEHQSNEIGHINIFLPNYLLTDNLGNL